MNTNIENHMVINETPPLLTVEDIQWSVENSPAHEYRELLIKAINGAHNDCICGIQDAINRGDSKLVGLLINALLMPHIANEAARQYAEQSA